MHEFVRYTELPKCTNSKATAGMHAFPTTLVTDEFFRQRLLQCWHLNSKRLQRTTRIATDCKSHKRLQDSQANASVATDYKSCYRLHEFQRTIRECTYDAPPVLAPPGSPPGWSEEGGETAHGRHSFASRALHSHYFTLQQASLQHLGALASHSTASLHL